MITILSVILLILLLLVGKTRGLKTWGIFYLNLFLIMAYLFIISCGFSAIINALILCIVVTITTLFGLNGVNTKTKASFKSIMFLHLVEMFSQNSAILFSPKP